MSQWCLVGILILYISLRCLIRLIKHLNRDLLFVLFHVTGAPVKVLVTVRSLVLFRNGDPGYRVDT